MTLRLPLALAGQQGPCPGCHGEIVAPDPHRGVGAKPAEAPPPPPEPEPFKPFAESPPLVLREQEDPVKLPEPVVQRPVRAIEDAPPPREVPAPVLRPAAASSQLQVGILACVLSALLGLVIGYAMGARSVKAAPVSPAISHVETPVAPSPVAAIDVTPPPDKPVAEAVVELAPPKLEPAPEVDSVPLAIEPVPPVPEPLPEEPNVAPPEAPKISAAAEASLRAFLDAPDWASRSAHVLSPESVKNAMEAYSHVAPDGQTPFKSIVVKDSHIDPKDGSTLFLFFVMTEKFPDGLPVALKETLDGWLVDWATFVEFRDSLFEKFADGPPAKAGVFHLVITKPDANRAASTENANFASFLLQSPMSTKTQLAFVNKNSELFDTIQAATEGGRLFSPVVEVAKRKTAGGKPYLEVEKIVSNDWFPR